MTVQPDLCRSCSQTTLLVFPQGGSIVVFYMIISVLLTDPNASPVIQTLLLVLHKNDLDLCQKYIHKVIKSSRIKDIEKGDNTDVTKYVGMVCKISCYTFIFTLSTYVQF